DCARAYANTSDAPTRSAGYPSGGGRRGNGHACAFVPRDRVRADRLLPRFAARPRQYAAPLRLLVESMPASEVRLTPANRQPAAATALLSGYVPTWWLSAGRPSSRCAMLYLDLDRKRPGDGEGRTALLAMEDDLAVVGEAGRTDKLMAVARAWLARPV